MRALLFVPGKIMTGVCFPDAMIENRFPHMTLLLNKWLAKNSNDALEATCSHEQHPFHDLYEKARLGQGMGEGHMVKGYKIVRDTVEAYFVILDVPIVFEGRYHEFN